MDRARNDKAQGTEKQVPGCLGRMVNLFDLSAGAASKKLLTYKPHFDDPSLTRSQADVPRILIPSRQNDIEDKMIILNSRRSSPNRQPNSMPMKMLIAQEMSREMESKHGSPNVVAKLMGLDGLPRQNPDLVADVSPSRDYSSPCLIPREIPYQSWLQEDTFVHERDASFKYQEIDDYKDIYEVKKISQKTNSAREMSPHMGTYGGKGSEKRRMVIQQKFMEAKCQATDEKLNQSKELQDALEVLNSKREFLREFIKEPNNLFSKHLQELESTCTPSETKRITVLRPSKMVDNEKYPMMRKKNEHLAKRPAEVSQEIRWGKSRSVGSPDYVNRGPQPTRIVVLKPSLGQNHEIKSISPPSMIPKKFPGENFFEEAEDGDVQLSREVAKEVTHHVHESMKGHRRDETLLSSVFSNGYSGDGSSFNKSEYEFPQQNCSDSEVLSPVSRHSWDCINRFDSPFSASSLSRASYSPESTVSREAKKRLSERFMASNKNTHEERHIHKTSGTLGEMLVLSDTKVSTRREEEGNNIEWGPRISASCLRNKSSEIEEVAESPKSLLRSKSLPVSSRLYSDAIRTRTSDPEASKMHTHKESKEKGLNSSFKGRVSNFFLSRSKRLSKEKSGPCESTDESRLAGVNSPESSICPRSKTSNHASQNFEENQIEASVNSARHGLLDKTTHPMQTVQNESSVSDEVGLSVSKPVLGSVGENQDQPSPISVLELSFDEDASIIHEYPGKQLPVQSVKSNLIDKSPPIGSIARYLSWGDYPERAFLCLSKPSTTYSGSKEEEKDCFVFIEKLLSISSLGGTAESYSHVSSWHSPHSPLDPLLREKYAVVDNDEPLNEAKRRQRRSNRKLVYDCVNAAIVDIAGFRPEECLVDRFCCGPGDLLMEEKSSITADIIWSQIKEWFTKVWSVSEDDEGRNCVVVERAVKEEIVGKGWLGHFRLEVDNLGREIEGELLEVLVAEALSDLVVSVC